VKNVIQEYLVKIGFDSDDPSLRKMTGTLEHVDKSVTSHTGGMTKRILEFQGTIVGAFTSVSAAIIGTVDKVAMADQSYRLLGLRMLMTTDSARKMDMITKALRADLAEIVWDPELHARAVQMAQDIDRWKESLGGDFEEKMRGLRDIRFEISRLSIAAKFLSMSFVSHLAERLGIGDLGAKLRQFVDGLDPEKISKFADMLASYAVPALKATWTMITQMVEVLKSAGLMFTNFVGLLSGDRSIQGAEFSFEHLAGAIAHVGSWMSRLFGWIAHAEEMLAHFASALSLTLSGKFGEAATEFKAGLKDLTGGSGLLTGMVGGAGIGGLIGTLHGGAAGAAAGAFLGPPGAIVGGLIGAGTEATVGTVAGSAIGAGIGAALGKLRKWSGIGSTEQQPSPSQSSVAPAIKPAPTVPTPVISGPPQLESPTFRILVAPPEQPTAVKSTPVEPERTYTAAEAVRTSGTTDGLVDRISAAITRYEAGTKPNPISIRNNNPGNLRPWWKGSGPFPVDEHGFIKFPDWDTGMRYLRKQVELNASRGLTLREFFGGKRGVYSGYAPAADRNKPETYAATVGDWVGIDVNTPLNRLMNSYSSGLEASRAPAQKISQSPIAASSFVAPDDRRNIQGPSPIPALDRDWRSVMEDFQRPIPSSSNSNVSNNRQEVHVDVGGIHIMNPGANPAEISRAVEDGVKRALDGQLLSDMTQLSPQF